MIFLANPTETVLTAVAVQPAAPGGGAGQVVVIGVPILIIALIVYLCRHRRHKISTAVLGFVAGVLLAGTALGVALAGGVTTLIVNAVAAIGGLFG